MASQSETTDELTSDLRERIAEYLLRPGSVSRRRARKLRMYFASNNHAGIERCASRILLGIEWIDWDLTKDLMEFTRYRACRVSLVRDVLVQTWERGKLATQPILVVQELEVAA